MTTPLGKCWGFPLTVSRQGTTAEEQTTLAIKKNNGSRLQVQGCGEHHPGQSSRFIPPENTRKPKALRCF